MRLSWVANGAQYGQVVLPLICVDVDGTLVGSSHVPTDAVWAAAAAAIDRGQHLALSTARGAFGPTLGYAKRLDPGGWHIFHNGGALVHAETGEIRASALSNDFIEAAAVIAKKQGWLIEFYSADEYTIDTDNKIARDHADLMGVPFVTSERDQLTSEIVRVQFVVPVELADRVQAELSGLDAVVVGATSPVQPGITFVSCTRPGVSKGAAIARIAAEMGIGVDQVMMVGDGENDVEAIGAVGHGVAMENAVPAAKAAAVHHVGHVDDDGFVQALELSQTL